MIVNQTPYPINFEMKAAQALTCRYGEVGRQYKFIADIDLTGLSANLQVIKPDGTFVIEAASVVVTEEEQYIIAEIPLQATVVKGVCRYDINLYQDDDLYLYTAEGPLWVDDQLITEDLIESIAEVYGLRFPQDFLTVENLVDIVHYVQAEIIKDDIIAEDTTWSSQKIEQEISGSASSIIDDNVTDTDTTWSSQKIEQEISGITPEITGTAEGNPIEITDAAAAPMVKCVTEITGSQDLHGYDKPWVGGAGKNKLPMTVSGIKSANTSGTWSGNVYTLNGVTFTIETDGDDNITGIKVNNSTVPTGITYLDLVGTFDSTTYAGMIFSGLPSTTPTGLTIRASANNRVSLQEFYPGDTPIVDNGNGLKLAIRLSTTVIANNVEILPMIRLSTVTDSTFAPYSNICPITAYTEGEIEVSDGDGNVTTHTTTYPSAIYRGSEDCVNGEVTTEWGIIASYAGETLPGEWISDRDEYAPGTTPTSGAQVAYELATPTTTPVTPTNLPIKSLSGYNHIESSTGDMNLEYLTQTYDPIAELIDRSSLHVYSTEEKIVGKWIDGRNVYEKSWEFDSYVNVGAYSTVSLASKGVTISDLGFFVNAICISGVDKRVHFPVAVGINNNEIGIQNETGSSMAIDKVVLRYTKTS